MRGLQSTAPKAKRKCPTSFQGAWRNAGGGDVVAIAGVCTISAGISKQLVYPSTCCALNAKRLSENRFSPWSGRILLHQHFVELCQTVSKRVSCQLYFVQHYNLMLFYGETDFFNLFFDSIASARSTVNSDVPLYQRRQT